MGSIRRIEVSTRSMETSTQSQFEESCGKSEICKYFLQQRLKQFIWWCLGAVAVAVAVAVTVNVRFTVNITVTVDADMPIRIAVTSYPFRTNQIKSLYECGVK